MGRLSLKEQHLLSKWKESNPKNRESLIKLEQYWKGDTEDFSKEEKEVREKIILKINHDLAKQDSRDNTSKRASFQWLYIAASLLVGCTLVYALWFSQRYTKNNQVSDHSVTMLEKESLLGQKTTTQLPDGTLVKINGGSRLIFPANFGPKKRIVTLYGEAFFDVKKDSKRPFIIHTEKLDVQVLGTSFNVQAYSNSPISVAVRTGKVAVSDSLGDHIMLNPKEQITLMENTLVKSTIDLRKNPFGWLDQQLVFNDENIDQVFRKITRWYGYKVVRKVEFNTEKKYHASYENPTLQEVMEVLSFVYKFQYVIDDLEKEIIIQKT